MGFKGFIENNGFKILALAKLKSPSYSILLYLFNEMAAGATEVIASTKELASFLGINEKYTLEGLNELTINNMILFTEVPGKPLRIKLQEDLNAWKVKWKPENKKNTLGDAKNLHPLVPQKTHHGSLGEIKLADTPENHPIPFPNPTKIKIADPKTQTTQNPAKDSTNLVAFREKHELSTARIRTLAGEELKKAKQEQKRLTPDEELLLQILMKHHNPRKQLYWALKAQLMYPNLNAFLDAARALSELNET